ncbi:hypothetical protein BHE74_00034257, partial [Ensete ventricosum]
MGKSGRVISPRERDSRSSDGRATGEAAALEEDEKHRRRDPAVEALGMEFSMREAAMRRYWGLEARETGESSLESGKRRGEAGAEGKWHRAAICFRLGTGSVTRRGGEEIFIERIRSK